MSMEPSAINCASRRLIYIPMKDDLMVINRRLVFLNEQAIAQASKSGPPEVTLQIQDTHVSRPLCLKQQTVDQQGLQTTKRVWRPERSDSKLHHEMLHHEGQVSVIKGIGDEPPLSVNDIYRE